MRRRDASDAGSPRESAGEGSHGGRNGGDRTGQENPSREPLKSYERILREEIHLADAEMARPAKAIAFSGLLAGIGIGVSVFLIGVFGTVTPEGSPQLMQRLLVGNAYAAGFLLVIFARADLFTEYTTIALLPVMVGRSKVRSLARLWGIVYAANILGAVLVALFLVQLGRVHAGFDVGVLTDAALELTASTFGGMLLSAILAGWLMGLMSWLIVAARETVSQVIFVWVIGLTIGLGHLHHCITGTSEVVVGMVASTEVGTAELLRFLGGSTLGNAIGALLFATLIRYSVATSVRGGSEQGDPGAGGGAGGAG